MSAGPFSIPPGDPAGLRAAAAQFGRLAEEHARLRASFQRAASQTLERWTGGFADRFRAAVEEVAIRFDPVSRSAKDAQRALTTYADVLEAARRTVDAANTQAAALAGLHHDPVARQQAMGQLDQQASAALSSVDRAAALCAARLAEAEAATAAACHDAVSVGRLRADIERASAELKAADPAAWERVFGPEGSLWRDVIEKVHTGLAAAGFDYWMWRAGAAERWMSGLQAQETQWLYDLLGQARDAGQPWASVLDTWYRRADAGEAFGEQWVEQTKWLGISSRIGRLVGGPLAIAGDVLTFIEPPQAGVMGNVDRGVAAVNAVAAGADTALAVGEMAGIGALEGTAAATLGAVIWPVGVATGLYLAGAYAYKHWAWFRNDVARPIGHAVVSAVKDVGHALSSVVNTITSWF